MNIPYERAPAELEANIAAVLGEHRQILCSYLEEWHQRQDAVFTETLQNLHNSIAGGWRRGLGNAPDFKEPKNNSDAADFKEPKLKDNSDVKENSVVPPAESSQLGKDFKNSFRSELLAELAIRRAENAISALRGATSTTKCDSSTTAARSTALPLNIETRSKNAKLKSEAYNIMPGTPVVQSSYGNLGNFSATVMASFNSFMWTNSTSAVSPSASVRRIATMLGVGPRRSTRLQGSSAARGGLLSKIVESKSFEAICASVILANAVLIGWSSNYAMEHLTDQDNFLMGFAELCFCIFYTLEIVLRVSYHRRRYFYALGWKWNLFDFALVLFSIGDQLNSAIQSGEVGAGSPSNISFLRVMRLMKMLKLLRMIRLLKWFRELRLILNSVMGSIKSMMWSLLLITAITYMVGVAFLQACTNHLRETDPSPSTREGINLYWSSVENAMLSLYTASLGGENWVVYVQPLQDVGVIFHLLFLLYIAFFNFVVLNTLTSLFVESVIENSEHDQQMVIHLELERKDQYIARLKDFYDELDDDGGGEVTYENFCKHLNAPEMHGFAASLQIDATDTKQFFRILSDNGRRPVDLETFVIGCIKLKGLAKSMDVMDIMYAQRRAAAEQREFATDCIQRLARVELMLDPGAELWEPSRPSGESTSPRMC